MSETRMAVLIGATGLIGSFVLQLLLAEKRYSRVKIFVRKPMDLTHSKLEQYIIDFDQPGTYRDLVKGDDLFCCLGTTMRTAGSKEAFYKVDHTYPVAFGKLGYENGIKQYLLVSSLGANSRSSNFYLKVKGETEDELQKTGFRSLIILRPSMLLGPRKEFRLGELIGKFFMQMFFFLFIGTLKKYRAIQAQDVAKAMVRLAGKKSEGVRVFESDAIVREAEGA
jgi:uncharacterized protein YbjT (DUF2867 family)